MRTPTPHFRNGAWPKPGLGPHSIMRGFPPAKPILRASTPLTCAVQNHSAQCQHFVDGQVDSRIDVPTVVVAEVGIEFTANFLPANPSDRDPKPSRA